ncbi:MAG: PKD domain-containing protein [Fimbriimonadaceae bacterium]|nr:PKD domain-containing protein [Chitinophagales bacterium]
MRTILLTILSFIALSMFAQNSAMQTSSFIQFTENKGQWQQNILFKSDLHGNVIYLEKNNITFDLANAADLERLSHPHHKDDPIPEDKIINRHCYKVWFEGSNADVHIITDQRSTSYNNYFIGNDKSKWANNVFSFKEITYQNIYPNIDLKIYSRGENFKYDFILHPGADAKNIKLRYEGLDNISLYNNILYLDASFAQLTESQPIAYIQTQQYKLPVQCNYMVSDNIVTFVLPQLYDKNYPLIIDPELIFASYSGSTSDNWGSTATFDSDGNLYGGGIAFGSGYPTTTGAYETTYAGGTGFYAFDVSISKFNTIGTDLIWSTYLGGEGNEFPHSLIVNNAGELLIYGTTGSDDFPMTADAYDDSFNGGPFEYVDDVLEYTFGIDIFLAKLSADGTALNGATYIGGDETDGANLATATLFNYGDNARGEVIIDESDNVYVASCTYSSDFPTTGSVFQTSIGGNQDGCIFKFNSDLSSLTWSTFIGGSAADGAYSLKRNSTGDIYACGGTASTGFPATAGSWDATYNSATDGWIAKINATATSIVACSFVGTNSYDQTYFVEIDDDDNVYITGQSKGSYPVIDADYSETGGKQYITKLNPDLSDVIYSTIFGSGSSSVNISPSALLVDECQNVYVSGWGGNVNFEGSTDGMSTTADAIDASTDGSDFYFFVLKRNADDILYGSYFGGNGLTGEHVDGGTSRFDKSGTIYQAVYAGCGADDGFPTTSGSWSETNGSFNCNLGVGKIKLDLGGVYAVSDADPSLNGCAPFTVLFDNLSSDAEEYIWDFGIAGATSTDFEPTYTYYDTGTYIVQLIVVDSSTCNIRDTTYLTIEVSNGNIHANFVYEIEQSCDSLTATFSDASTVFPTTDYLWLFGDGTSSTELNPIHTYTTPGSYLVQLILYDSTSCNIYDTLEIDINYLFDFNTGYEVDAEGCLPVTADFAADFDGADAYFWDFGDGSTATTQYATHDYFLPGTYTVNLSITYCGYTDEYTETFTVFDLPVAYFDPEPSFGIANAPTTFVNLCEYASEYLWTFSDGTFSTEESPTKYFPGLGNFEVCLTATNPAGCEDTYCRNIAIENAGAADIPTGFSPNNDGYNDILYVKGFGFAKMELKIFDRWGQLVFEAYDQESGWDGTYKSKPLDMDVFVFTLKVDFTDGKHFDKTGNITLIR